MTTKVATTVCSTMFCYNQAKVTNDPAKPPFCESCKANQAKRKKRNG